MAKKQSDYISDPDFLSRKIKEIVREIHEDQDPHEMNAYKRFFKKNVSVFSRAYFNAYLIKQMDRQSAGNKFERTTNNNNTNTDGDKATLFVSVGKNRKVFPRDLITLFSENDAVDASDFGQIKVLDNYSFVEVEKGVAEKIIASFDGGEFRGRKLTVNHARKKN